MAQIKISPTLTEQQIIVSLRGNADNPILQLLHKIAELLHLISPTPDSAYSLKAKALEVIASHELPTTPVIQKQKLEAFKQAFAERYSCIVPQKSSDLTSLMAAYLKQDLKASSCSLQEQHKILRSLRPFPLMQGLKYLTIASVIATTAALAHFNLSTPTSSTHTLHPSNPPLPTSTTSSWIYSLAIPILLAGLYIGYSRLRSTQDPSIPQNTQG